MGFGPDSPSTVMFEDLRELGVSHKDVAKLLFDQDAKIGGKPIRERIESRTGLSRYFVHVSPGQVSRSLLVDFDRSIPNLAARLMAEHARKSSVPAHDLSEHFKTSAADKMTESLTAARIDPFPYRNGLERIDAQDVEDSDLMLLHLALFTVTGITGDVEEALGAVDQLAAWHVGASMRTVESTLAPDALQADDGASLAPDYPLGIIRIFDGMTMKPGHPLHPLPPTETGAVLGSGACDITDVDARVSRKHARIWKEGGRWYIEGLKSTNGVAVISGADKQVHEVEPPRSKRKRGYKPQPFEISPADIVCLGNTTRFLVQVIFED